MPPRNNASTSEPVSWPTYRPPHRRLADAQTHDEKADLPAIFEHRLVPGNAPAIVDTNDALAKLIHQLREAGQFAYDTEFIGEQTFHPVFCLIQVATADRVTLIDPLSETLDATPFWALLGDASVEKVVHAGQQDLEPAMRFAAVPAANVFDTQVAGGFIGKTYPLSLRKLMAEACTHGDQVDLGADHKFSRWDRRPLSQAQQMYAANDVRYLLMLRECLVKKLDDLGHRSKAQAEFEALCEPDALRNDPLSMKLRAKGAGRLRPSQQAVCDALRKWRYAEAEARDVPVRRFLDDQTLVDLAKLKPERVEDVLTCKGVPRPVKEHFAQTIVDLTVEALAGKLPDKRRAHQPMTDEAADRLAGLWPAVRRHAEDRSIDPTMLLSKRELTELVRADDEGRALPNNRLRQGWRAAFLRPVLGDLVTR
ncbi:MAG: HRDC domain-containing protein [Planctomycetota bacterium]